MNEKFAFDYRRLMGTNYKFGVRSIANYAAYHHVRFMYWWRSYENSPSRLKRLILFRYAHKYGLEISPSAKIGEGLYLGHPYNITVGGGG